MQASRLARRALLAAAPVPTAVAAGRHATSPPSAPSCDPGAVPKHSDAPRVLKRCGSSSWPGPPAGPPSFLRLAFSLPSVSLCHRRNRFLNSEEERLWAPLTRGLSRKCPAASHEKQRRFRLGLPRTALRAGASVPTSCPSKLFVSRVGWKPFGGVKGVSRSTDPHET